MVVTSHWDDMWDPGLQLDDNKSTFTSTFTSNTQLVLIEGRQCQHNPITGLHTGFCLFTK